MIWAVIMAGGGGTRFWPLSTPSRPKQLLAIATHRTMLEETVRRLSGFIPNERTLIITNTLQAAEVRRILPRIPKKNIVAEPCGRNTAPCIGLAAHILAKRDPNAVMAILPADQIITKQKKFISILRAAAVLAEQKKVPVMLGITPTFPATGFGYIESGKKASGAAFWVKRFIEKPPLSRAKNIFRKKTYSWNGGMFIWRVDTYLDMLDTYLPNISRGLKKIAASINTPAFSAVLRHEFPKLPSISVDYGIMEKTSRAVVIRSDIGWSDVGSWDTASAYWPKDKEGNAVRGNFLAVNAKGNMVLNQSGRVIAGVGIEDLIVVATADHILIAHKSHSQAVRTVPSLLINRK